MKKYTVNIHYDAVLSVGNIIAESEEEACRKASEMASTMSLHEAEVVGESQCVTAEDEVSVPKALLGKPEFEYHGRHFIPAGTFANHGIDPDFFVLSKFISSELEKALSKRNRNWNKRNFERAGNPSENENSWSDIFYCLENGKTYTPGENELFIITHPNIKF